MGRPKGSRNKPKARPPAKAKAKPKPPAKAEPPDWLRKAMAPTKTSQKRGPKPKALKEKFQQQAKAKRGKKPMAIKPHYDPMDDPDLRADTKGDLPPPESPIKPPARPDNALPDAPGTKPVDPRPGKPAPLPGGGVRPDNALPEEPEEAPKFDEVQSGAEIPDENMQMLIAGTMGGGGDHHAMAKRIVERMKEAKWVTTKAADAGSGDTAKAKSKAKGKDDDDRKDDKR